MTHLLETLFYARSVPKRGPYGEVDEGYTIVHHRWDLLLPRVSSYTDHQRRDRLPRLGYRHGQGVAFGYRVPVLLLLLRLRSFCYWYRPFVHSWSEGEEERDRGGRTFQGDGSKARQQRNWSSFREGRGSRWPPETLYLLEGRLPQMRDQEPFLRRFLRQLQRAIEGASPVGALEPRVVIAEQKPARNLFHQVGPSH